MSLILWALSFALVLGASAAVDVDDEGTMVADTDDPVTDETVADQETESPQSEDENEDDYINDEEEAEEDDIVEEGDEEVEDEQNTGAEETQDGEEEYADGEEEYEGEDAEEGVEEQGEAQDEETDDEEADYEEADDEAADDEEAQDEEADDEEADDVEADDEEAYDEAADGEEAQEEEADDVEADDEEAYDEEAQDEEADDEEAEDEESDDEEAEDEESDDEEAQHEDESQSTDDTGSPGSACDQPETIPTTPRMVSQVSSKIKLAWKAPTVMRCAQKVITQTFQTSRKLLMYHVEARSGRGDWYNLLSTLALEAEVPDLSFGGITYYRVVAVYGQCSSPSEGMTIDAKSGETEEGGGGEGGNGAEGGEGEGGKQPSAQLIRFLGIYDAQDYTVRVTLENATQSRVVRVKQSSCKSLHCTAELPKLINGRKYTYTIRANTGQPMRGGEFTAGTQANEEPPLLLRGMNRYWKVGDARQWFPGRPHWHARWQYYKWHDHFYTTDALEKESYHNPAAKWKFEGTTASLMADNIHQCPEAVPLYRMYNPRRPWHDHFLTASEAEKNRVQTHKGGRWIFQGKMGYCVRKPGLCGATLPLHRYFNAHWHDHWYISHRPKTVGKGVRYERVECYAWRNLAPIELVMRRHNFDFKLPNGSISYTIGIRTGHQTKFEPVTGNNIGNMERTCKDLKCRVVLESLEMGANYQVRVKPVLELADRGSSETDTFSEQDVVKFGKEIVETITAGISQQEIPFWGTTNAANYTITIAPAGAAELKTNKTAKHGTCVKLSCKVTMNNLVQSKQYRYYIVTDGGMKLRGGHFVAGNPTVHLPPLTIALYEVYHPYGKNYRVKPRRGPWRWVRQNWLNHAYRNSWAGVQHIAHLGWAYMNENIHLLPNKLQCPEAIRMYQIYQPKLHDHMLTASVAERHKAMSRWGWRADQNQGLCVRTKGACGANKPIYRWYSKKYQNHMVSTHAKGSAHNRVEGKLCFGY